MNNKQTNMWSFEAARTIKDEESRLPPYQGRIRKMDKLELLNEMVHFQEERAKIGQLTPSMIVRGKILFSVLENQAETAALRALTGSYRRHLEHEMSTYLKTGEITVLDDDDDE